MTPLIARHAVLGDRPIGDLYRNLTAIRTALHYVTASMVRLPTRSVERREVRTRRQELGLPRDPDCLVGQAKLNSQLRLDAPL